MRLYQTTTKPYSKSPHQNNAGKGIRCKSQERRPASCTAKASRSLMANHLKISEVWSFDFAVLLRGCVVGFGSWESKPKVLWLGELGLGPSGVKTMRLCSKFNWAEGSETLCCAFHSSGSQLCLYYLVSIQAVWLAYFHLLRFSVDQFFVGVEMNDFAWIEMSQSLGFWGGCIVHGLVFGVFGVLWCKCCCKECSLTWGLIWGSLGVCFCVHYWEWCGA